MKKVHKRLTSIVLYIVCVLIVMSLAVYTGYTFAIFSDEVATTPQTLSFGNVNVVEGNNATQISLGAVSPGMVITPTTSGVTVNSSTMPSGSTSFVSFKHAENSVTPFYIRCKVSIVCDGAQDANITEFLKGLEIGDDENSKVVLTFADHWVLSDGYYYYVTAANGNILKSVEKNDTANFITKISIPKNLKSTVTVNNVTYENVQDGKTFKFQIDCQAIQSANVSSDLTTAKSVFDAEFSN